MATTIWGVVKGGCVVPDAPLPEGAHVEIRIADPPADFPEALRAEFEAWDRATPKPWTSSNTWHGSKMPMRRGEVWRVRIPFAPGHAQAGDRPALIVQNDPLIASLPTVLIVPFTSTPGAARFPGTLVVSPDGQNGLTVPSVALVFQLCALDKRDCLQRLGVLDAATLDGILAQVDQLIR